MKFIPILFWVLAFVCFIPMIVAIIPSKNTKLYGIVPGDKVQTVLLQHRVLLLGLVGVALRKTALADLAALPVAAALFYFLMRA